eukprot:TRINITY_DN66881_c3_g2_i1.p1 TRINITY_DN66881_c3_g2~~TRINITY_DN66881_c3_g2_i1.p1  ORF type:complete len:108 (-),score=3.60 TRINITY_DN66881_c3_g2_i1:362-685(-)
MAHRACVPAASNPMQCAAASCHQDKPSTVSAPSDPVHVSPSCSKWVVSHHGKLTLKRFTAPLQSHCSSRYDASFKSVRVSERRKGERRGVQCRTCSSHCHAHHSRGF